MYLSYLAQYNTNNTHPTNNQINIIGNPNITYEQIDEVLNFMVTASQQLKMALDHIKYQNDAIREAAINQIRIQAEIEKQEALIKQRNEVVTILRNLLPSDGDLIVQQLLTQLQMENIKSNKICSNCARDAYLECTACRNACYCSPFCQKKDWVQHQHDCTLQQLFDSASRDNNNNNNSVDSAVVSLEHASSTSTVLNNNNNIKPNHTITTNNPNIPPTNNITIQ